MIGSGYWTTGITLTPKFQGEWGLSLDFYDDGFAVSDSSEGTLRLRYIVVQEDLDAALAVLVEDAKRIGITFGKTDPPTVYVKNDGEEYEGGVLVNDRPDWRRLANECAERLGWRPVYSAERVSNAAR